MSRMRSPNRGAYRATIAALFAIASLAVPCTAVAQSETPRANPTTSAGADNDKSDKSEKKKAEAEAHFREGVLLFKDNDYAGALVELKRAQAIAPNYRALYNIGQTHYQLQHYAEAISAFEAYLAQGGSQIPAARRASLEADLQLLRARVAKIEITVNVDGAEVRVDDE